MSEPEITAALEEVKRLDAEATPGPWQSAHPWSWEGLCTIIGDLDEDDGSQTYTTVCDVNEDPARWEANICLINRYRTLAPLLASELERVRKENAWQDIASAPRDGTYILAWRALLDVPLVVTWERPAQTPPMMRLVSTERHDHEGFWRQPMSAKPTPYQPTHWQPLPLPPQAKGE